MQETGGRALWVQPTLCPRSESLSWGRSLGASPTLPPPCPGESQNCASEVSDWPVQRGSVPAQAGCSGAMSFSSEPEHQRLPWPRTFLYLWFLGHLTFWNSLST